MPGRFFLTHPIEDVAWQLGVPLRDVAGEPIRHNIAPGQQIVTLTEGGLRYMRWGIVPVGRVNARGRPVMETLINARSETVFSKSAYKGVGRAIVPVTGWYEWTGEKRRKIAWSLSAKDGSLLYFAAVTDVWKAPGGIDVPQVATVTCEPNADVAAIHHRMGVILDHSDMDQWLSGDEADLTALMKPLPNGRLDVKEAEDVDWSGA
jgi:putative SOS response-associated peptidase YedK